MTAASASELTPSSPEGTHNFRDVGGLPVVSGDRTRVGVLYRSDALSDLTPRGLDQLAASDIEVVIDFRTDTERQMAPDRLPASPPPRSIRTSVHQMFCA